MKGNKKLIAVGCALAAGGMAVQSQAADWVSIQGNEPPTTGLYKFFGVVQATYVNAFDCDNMMGLSGGAAANNGQVVNQCRWGPELHNNEEAFTLDTLLLGMRGNLIPGKINYYLTVNAGENLANYEQFNTDRKHDLSITDASVTFNYIPGVRVRAGLMRKPGPEEAYQAIDANDYVFTSDYITRTYFERFVNGNAKSTAPIAGQGYAGSVSKTAYDMDLGRDWGVMFYDAFKQGKWTHTYSVMLGRGNGIHWWNERHQNGVDTNLYASTEYDLPGGKGPLKHGVKAYGYYQEGERNFLIDAAGTKSQDFDRIRYGVGFKALGELFGEDRGKHRVGGSVDFAEGMVFLNPTGNAADAPFGGLLQHGADKGNKTWGYSLDYGYYPNKNWQFDLRYAVSHIFDDTVAPWTFTETRVIEEITFGGSYHISPNTRLTADYQIRQVTAPNLTWNNAADRNAIILANTVGDRVGVRLTHVFK